MTSAFRHHDARPALAASPLFSQLIDEWIHLNQLPTSTMALRRWARLEPDLAGYRRPADVVDAIDQADRDHEDRALTALIRLTQAGHQLAGRVLLQQLLPKLGKMAWRAAPGSTDTTWAEDRRHVVVAEFWEVVTSYPVDRKTSKVAANLALDTLHRVTEPRRHPTETPLGIDWDDVETHLVDDLQRHAVDAPAPGELTADADLVELLTWAVHHDVIDQAEAQLLAAVYLPDPDQRGSSADHAAARLGITPAAARQRCSRARRRIIAAVRTDQQPRQTRRAAA